MKKKKKKENSARDDPAFVPSTSTLYAHILDHILDV